MIRRRLSEGVAVIFFLFGQRKKNKNDDESNEKLAKQGHGV